MWWRGWRRKRPASCRDRNSPAQPILHRPEGSSERQEVSRRQFFVKLGVALNGLAAVVLATPVIGYLLAPIFRSEGRRLSKMDFARRTRRVSRRTDTPGEVQESNLECLGWRDRQYSLLGAPRAGRAVPGLRHQLRPPRLSGALVPAVGTVHVPVPRRRVLPGWLAGLGSAASAVSSSIRTRLRAGT